MFFGMGTMGNYMRTMKLQSNWELKKQGVDPSSINATIKDLVKQQEQQQKTVKLNTIAGKLKTGGELTPAELEYLRQNSPQLFQKALEVAKERKEHREALQRCRTKEEAERVHNNKLNQFANEIRAVEQSGMSGGDKLSAMEGIQMRMAGVEDEYRKFLQGGGRSLPREAQLKKAENQKKEKLEEARKKRTEAREALQGDFEEARLVATDRAAGITVLLDGIARQTDALFQAQSGGLVGRDVMRLTLVPDRTEGGNAFSPRPKAQTVAPEPLSGRRA